MSFSGALSTGGPNSANPTGVMDEVRMYNRALSAQEVVAVYNDPGLSVGTAPSVSLFPSAATLQSSGAQQFRAAVTGESNSAVSWSISPAVGGISTSGSLLGRAGTRA
jgi:hypothetical protein